ncbi:MAG: FIST C-terminal domain-containing protein [Desulfobacterales bacterium]|nr:FIST C-terminal domain-containing protein [Desulfobacterales bacterium]
MIVKWNKTDAIDELGALIADVSAIPGVKSLFVLSCEKNGYSEKAVNRLLAAVELPIFGGIFPAVIAGKRLLERGNLVFGLGETVSPVMVPELGKQRVDYESLLDELIPHINPGNTVVVFVDGFSKQINAFIESLFTVFGLEVNYVGGGAGSLSMVQRPCLFTNAGIVKDAALLVPMGVRSGIGVSHGWETLQGPFRVTGADQNTISTLDWRPAFEVYHEILSDHFGSSPFIHREFYDVAKGFPFGIARMGSEQIVRDPISTDENGGLICVGEVPEGAFVSVLRGNETSLITAAGRALEMGQAALPNDCSTGVHLVVDCISRVLFLDDRFHLELEALGDGKTPVFGACTLGEIANSGQEFIEFYNKTCVVAVIEDIWNQN